MRKLKADILTFEGLYLAGACSRGNAHHLCDALHHDLSRGRGRGRGPCSLVCRVMASDFSACGRACRGDHNRHRCLADDSCGRLRRRCG